MKLTEAIKQTKKVYFKDNPDQIVKHFIRISGMNAIMEKADMQTADEEYLLLFEGNDPWDRSTYKISEAGFKIDQKGNGYLYIPDASFFLSFTHYLFNDNPNMIGGANDCFIPFHPSFQELRTAYDYFLTQEGRVSENLNRETYVDALARAGVTHVEVNGLGFPMGLETGPKGETYPMFYTYCPAMDQFVYSSLNKGIYPYYFLSKNLAYLKENAKMAVERGLKPGMMSFEPRSVPEELFNRYPMLRGARIDHPFRSFKPRYNLTITHPLVLNHYYEMTQKLLLEVPELDFFTIWTNDSGAGFEHTKSLYVGRNGGAYMVREWKDDDTIARLAGEYALNFMQTILEAGREINPNFRVITRLESFYGEIDTMWPGFKDGLQVETNSLVAKGWAMPYKHVQYPDSGVLNGGGLHHQSLDPEESEKYKELSKRKSVASFYFGMGPQVMFAPLMGVPYPRSVWNRLKQLQQAEIEHLVVYGGTFPPESVPWFINYEMIRHFQFDPEANPEKVIGHFANQWTEGRHDQELIDAWNLIEDAVLNFPNISTLYNTIGFSWYRLWTRPLVPDIEAIPEEERAYYQDFMCTTPHNPNNVDLSRDVLFQIADLQHCSKAVGRIDQNVIPKLNQAISILKLAVDSNEGVIYDQYIRTRALKAYLITHRNIGEWINEVYGYMKSESISEKQKHRAMLDEMIRLEIQNMDDLCDLFNSGVSFISLMQSGETPLMYGKNIVEQIRLKQELMHKYGHLEPRIDPDYVIRKSGEIMK